MQYLKDSRVYITQSRSSSAGPFFYAWKETFSRWHFGYLDIERVEQELISTMPQALLRLILEYGTQPVRDAFHFDLECKQNDRERMRRFHMRKGELRVMTC